MRLTKSVPNFKALQLTFSSRPVIFIYFFFLENYIGLVPAFIKFALYGISPFCLGAYRHYFGVFNTKRKVYYCGC